MRMKHILKHYKGIQVTTVQKETYLCYYLFLYVYTYICIKSHSFVNVFGQNYKGSPNLDVM